MSDVNMGLCADTCFSVHHIK